MRKYFDVAVAGLDVENMGFDGLGSLAGIERSYTCFVVSVEAVAQTCFERVDHDSEEMQLMLASSIGGCGIWEDMGVACARLPLNLDSLVQQGKPHDFTTHQHETDKP